MSKQHIEPHIRKTILELDGDIAAMSAERLRLLHARQTLVDLYSGDDEKDFLAPSPFELGRVNRIKCIVKGEPILPVGPGQMFKLREVPTTAKVPRKKVAAAILDRARSFKTPFTAAQLADMLGAGYTPKSVGIALWKLAKDKAVITGPKVGLANTYTLPA